MSEVTVAQPLSGIEVIDAVLAKLRSLMIQDCYLSPNSAYESFTADVTVKIRALDIGRIAESSFKAHEESVTQPTADDEDYALREAEIHLAAMPPNQVRQETGQPIPTLVDVGDGKKEIRPVRYAKHPVPIPGRQGPSV